MSFNRRKQAPVTRSSPVLIEPLETRAMLSGTVLSYDRIVEAADGSAATIQGLTPDEVLKAYNFDDIRLTGATANGSGQTIAIVDAYNDPNIAADLAVFDTAFGLPGTTLSVVNQTGGSKLPATDTGWAGEISLDVEWAHAIAPGAKILLVETASDDTSDLMAGVNYARTAGGVSVVSLSWGGSEFFGFNGGSESSSQTAYDSDFTTPSGHIGVTFVAAAGDSGTQSGVEWPASSPNVLSVGGTTLSTDTDGTYESETGWSGTSGGVSQVEAEPAYQDVVQNTGYRSAPDVAYDADPNTGFAVYDSLADDGDVGWQEIGGTSAGAPQWSALVAIADQGRELSGLSTLDGASQTLPDLYSVYSAYGTTEYTDVYSTDFNDVTSGGGSDVHYRWGGHGGPAGNTATVGYDTLTGLGSPKADAIVALLTGSTTSGTTGSTGSGGTTGSGGSSTSSSLAASPLTVTILGKISTSVVGDTAGIYRVDITNATDARFTGPVTISLFLSSDGTASGTAVATMTLSTVTLRSGKSRVVVLKFTYPSPTADETLTPVVTASATATDTADATAVAPSSVTVAAPSIDLSTAFVASTIRTVPGKTAVAAVKITNDGNVTASGTITLTLYAGDVAVGTITGRKLNLRAGKATVLRLRFTVPDDFVEGTDVLTAVTSSSTSVVDTNGANDSATVATA